MVTLDFKNLWYIYKKPMLNIDIYRFRYKDEKKNPIQSLTKLKSKQLSCYLQFLLLLFSRSVVSNSLWLHGQQHTRPPCPSLFPGVCWNPCPLCRWCHPTISSSITPSPPAFNLSQHQGLFQWVSSSHQMAKVLKLQHQSFQWIFRADLL